LHIEIAHLLAGGDVDRLVLAIGPHAGGVIAGRMRGHDVAHLLVRGLADRGQYLIGGADVGIKDQNPVVRHHEDGVAGAARVFHHENAVGDLTQLHAIRPVLRQAWRSAEPNGKNHSEKILPRPHESLPASSLWA
jgi:hypothetical protein